MTRPALLLAAVPALQGVDVPEVGGVVFAQLYVRLVATEIVFGELVRSLEKRTVTVPLPPVSEVLSM